MDIFLKIEDSKYESFLALIKTLDYVQIHELAQESPALSYASEPLLAYKKTNRPSVDDIEQLIIAKALRDAKAIERGELETRDIDELFAELENEERQ